MQETNFTESQFFDEFYAEDLIINKTVWFNKTEFFYTGIIGGHFSSVDFQKINLTETGKISFRGKEPFYDQVKGEIYLDFTEDSKGTTIIENFNLNKFENNSKLRLFEAEKTGRVQIGTGCRKYKNRTPIKRIDIDDHNQNLVTELANTFAQFFKSKNGLNLGVEIEKQTNEFIEFYYFSDADIDYSTFLQMLAQSEGQMWKLVKVKNQTVIVEKENKTEYQSNCFPWL